MAEIEDTRAALARLEAALSRIAALGAKPRPAAPLDQEGAGDLAADSAEAEAAAEAERHEIVTKLDDLIGGLRNALGVKHPS